jgi:aspartyl aminopeptidase
MAHALHPNYAEKHEEHHQPLMHKGVVLKMNSNQRYATSAATALPLRIIAERRGLQLQVCVCVCGGA